MGNNLLNRGINVGKSIDSDISLDYEMLYCSNPPDDDFRNLPLTEWPRRIVVYKNGSNNSANVPWAISSGRIGYPDKQETILEVYDKWIEFLKYRRGIRNKIRLSLYFEHMENHWKSSNEIKTPAYMDMIRAISGPASTLNPINDLLDISIWRHKKIDSVINDLIGNSNILYYQHASYADAFFSYLCSLNPNDNPFQTQYFLRQLMEMALFRVVIIDERIAQTVAGKANPTKLNDSLGHLLAWMGVWIVGEVVFKNGTKEENITVGSSPTAENGLVKIIFDYKDSDKIETSFQYAEGTRAVCLPTINISRIELLSVHQTIIDNKFREPIGKVFHIKDQAWKERWIDLIRPDVLFFYSHSGRGHVRSLLPKNASFLEYSFFQTHILNPTPSKFFLVQLAMASKEERRLK